MTEETTAARGAVAGQVERPVRPAAWMVRQGSRTYYVSDAEFVRSSYDSGEFVPLYGPEALAAERERCIAELKRAATSNWTAKSQEAALWAVDVLRRA